MKFFSTAIAIATGCAITAVPRASAAVSDEDFNALKKIVEDQGRKLDQQDEKIEQLENIHRQDQQQIQQLQQYAAQSPTNAGFAASPGPQIQPDHPVPPGISATHDFTLVGDAEVQFGKTDGQHSTFALADFAPIFLFRTGDNVLFEAGFDVTLANNVDANGHHIGGAATAVDLSFAQLDYLFSDYVTLVAGDVLLPLGTYSERSAGWLNKIPDDPLARDLVPGSGIGVEFRGAFPLGEDGQTITYSIYGVNGPSSSSPAGTANAADLDLGGNVGDTANWHANPSAGGRLAWFYPWKAHYDFELGVSGQSGEWSDSGNRLYSAMVLDAALHLGPYFEAKGEYIDTWVETDDLGTINPNGLWTQASYKLAGLGLDFSFVNNLELVGRYDHARDGQGTHSDRYTAGYVYYFSNTLLFEGDYEFIHSRGPNALPSNAFVLQLSYGF